MVSMHVTYKISMDCIIHLVYVTLVTILLQAHIHCGVITDMEEKHIRIFGEENLVFIYARD